MNGRVPSRRAAEEGSSTVELSIITSVLLLLIVGSVEIGRAFWTYNTMLLAVEEAARYAMVHSRAPPQVCSAQSQASQCPTLSNTPLANCSAERAERVLSDYQASGVGVSVKEDTTSSPATMTICTSYSLDFLAPQLLPNGPFNLTSRVTVPLI